MKRIYQSIIGLSLISLPLLTTSCIDETEPTNAATEAQIQSSDRAMSALLWGMPSMLLVEDADGAHYRYGYGTLMQVRDVMTGDFCKATHSYDHFSSWARNTAQGENYAIGQYLWNISFKFIQSTNEMIKNVPDPDNATDNVKGYLGAGYAFRAMLYLDAARMYEFLPNDKTSNINSSGNDVLNLTVPIVTDKTAEESARNNPRATHKEMFEFILSDLDNAEKYIPYLNERSEVLPHLDAVYGLKARLYMWDEDYVNAEKYARLAIDNASVVPMTEEEMTSPTKGFNDITCWMWGGQLVKENDAVQTGIINWASWMCNETSFGYASAGPRSQIDAAMYARISDTDYRKNLWAPATYSRAPQWYQENCIAVASALNADGTINSRLDGVGYRNWNAYTSIKFRPASGNTEDYAVAASTAFPIMRVEEMYFIEAEAAAHQNAARGKQLLEDFMKNYRDPSYSTLASTTDDVVEETVFQKRVELWGEGQSFFDIKRLNMSVTRGYNGTNHISGDRFNTNGRPAWMNLVIVVTESNNNKALVGMNNPDPTGKYTNWSAN